MFDGTLPYTGGLMLAFLASAATGFNARADDDSAGPNVSAESSDGTLGKLSGLNPAEEQAEEDLLERAVRGMRSAEERIASRDSSPKTREIQQRVVDDLARLIEALEKQRSGAQSSSSLPMNQQRQQSSRSDERGGEESQPGNATGEKTGEEKAKDSAKGSRKPGDRQPGLIGGPDDLVTDVWGHLPPRLRQQLLNVYQDKYLPQYDELVRRYFESLAEEGRKQRRR